jgi:hypothetical protein
MYQEYQSVKNTIHFLSCYYGSTLSAIKTAYLPSLLVFLLSVWLAEDLTNYLACRRRREGGGGVISMVYSLTQIFS